LITQYERFSKESGGLMEEGKRLYFEALEKLGGEAQ